MVAPGKESQAKRRSINSALSPEGSARIPANSTLNRLIPIALLVLALVTLALILFALGILFGLIAY
jgi:hypothetical protein